MEETSTGQEAAHSALATVARRFAGHYPGPMAAYGPIRETSASCREHAGPKGVTDRNAYMSCAPCFSLALQLPASPCTCICAYIYINPGLCGSLPLALSEVSATMLVGVIRGPPSSVYGHCRGVANANHDNSGINAPGCRAQVDT